MVLNVHYLLVAVVCVNHYFAAAVCVDSLTVVCVETPVSLTENDIKGLDLPDDTVIRGGLETEDVQSSSLIVVTI